ncbi:hypothetical protein RI367_005340 [Sorochytrium milnesiophthora]
MTAKSMLLAAVCLLSAVYSANAQCDASNTRIRKEVRDLSPDEWNRYANAVQQLDQTPSKRPQYTSISAFEERSGVHVDNWFTPHGDIRFLPWHRLYLTDYENALREIDPTVTIPYWGWDEDSDNPEGSPVMTAAAYGSSVPNQCIPDGPFQSFTTHVVRTTPGSSVDAQGAPRCVTRGFDPNGQSSRIPSTAVLGQLISQSARYSDFSKQLEDGPHGQVHVWVGGDMGQRFSPNDPIFFAHHAFIDKMFTDFQAQRNLPYEGAAYNLRRPVSSRDQLTPFTKSDGTPYTVADVWDPNTFCVSYVPRGQGGNNNNNNGGDNGNNQESVHHSVSAAATTTLPPPFAGTLPPIPDLENVGHKTRPLLKLSEEWARMMGVPFADVQAVHANMLNIERQIAQKVRHGERASLKYPHAPLPKVVVDTLLKQHGHHRN